MGEQDRDIPEDTVFHRIELCGFFLQVSVVRGLNIKGVWSLHRTYGSHHPPHSQFHSGESHEERNSGSVKFSP